MKRLLPASVLVLSLLGCTNTGFLGFIATTGYVDKHLATAKDETQAQIAETSNEVNKVRSDVETLNRLKSTLQSLIDDVQQTKESTQELKDLTRELQSKLDSIPEATLRTLVEVLQDYLDNSSPATRTRSN